MAFFREFMARFRDWHEANKRGQRRIQPWGVRGRVYEKRPDPAPEQPSGPISAPSRVEAILNLAITKANGDKIFISRRATGS